MSKSKGTKSTSVSLDKELLEIIEETPGVKRSTLLNDLGWNWAEENDLV